MRRLMIMMLLVSCDGVDRDNDGIRAFADCDDHDAAVGAIGPELCNGVDDDCNGLVDDGAYGDTVAFVDFDRDGVGAGEPLLTCGMPQGYSPTNGDCDDMDGRRSPAAVEVCDEVDNDCNGLVDDEPEDGVPWYRDLDQDGYGDNEGEMLGCGELPEGFVLGGGDCDDFDPYRHPNAQEYCDYIDNDCDDAIDEGSIGVEWYRDGDGDGYGDPSVAKLSCRQPSGHVFNGEDCDDSRDQVHPGADEVCGDGRDNDCDGSIDEDC